MRDSDIPAIALGGVVVIFIVMLTVASYNIGQHHLAADCQRHGKFIQADEEYTCTVVGKGETRGS